MSQLALYTWDADTKENENWMGAGRMLAKSLGSRQQGRKFTGRIDSQRQASRYMSGVTVVFVNADPKANLEKVISNDETTILFSQLSESWKSDTFFLSSLEKIAMHHSYQRIIGMGKDALPFIFRDLNQTSIAWFWALKAITGVNPVPEEIKGNVPEMVVYWEKWARENSYL